MFTGGADFKHLQFQHPPANLRRLRCGGKFVCLNPKGAMAGSTGTLRPGWAPELRLLNSGSRGRGSTDPVKRGQRIIGQFKH